MAGKQPARSGVRAESIEEFMARRAREVANYGRAAEEAAHAAVRKAIRAGQGYRLSTPSEVMAYGASLLGARPSNSPDKPKPPSPVKRSALDDNRAAKLAGGVLAYGAGLVPGVAPGVVHTVGGAIDGAQFAVRLANPTLDLLTSAPGQSAAAQVLNAGLATADYVKRGIEDPSMVRRDLASEAHKFRLKEDPTATPMADTLGGEMKRTFDIGMNNGELAFDVGSLLVGGEAIKGAAGLGRMAKAAGPKELAFLARNPGTAAGFERLYPKSGMSHHIVNRAATLPKLLGGGRYPDWFIESEFNKIRHDAGISYRDLYRNHNGVGGPKHFTRGPIGRQFGGGGWNAEDLGWTEYGPLDKLNYGTSPATKAVVGPALVGGVADDYIRDDA